MQIIKIFSPARTLIVSSSFVIVFTAIFLVMTAAAQGISRGYETQDEMLKTGMVVVLNTTNTDKPSVERASRESIDRVIGVTTDSDSNLLTIGSAAQQVYVQDSGVVSVFASNVNGEIKKGDKLTLSPLKGILMRADDVSLTIGSAIEDFSPTGAESQMINLEDGKKTILINKLNVAIDNALATQQPVNDKSTLEKLGKSVTGKYISEIKVIIALVIFLIVMIAEGSIIYGAISSGMISVGRNPMAKNVIKRELVRVLVISVIVLFIGLAAIYFILAT